MKAVNDISIEEYKVAEKLESDLKISTNSSKTKNSDVSKTNNNKPPASSNNKEKISVPKNINLKVVPNKIKNKVNSHNLHSTSKGDEIIYERTTNDHRREKKAKKYQNKGGGNEERHRGKGRKRLEKCFGWFSCRQCDNYWTSAYTWRIKGTYRVIYRQQCNKCKMYLFPYKTDYLMCSMCENIVLECNCHEIRVVVDERKKPHIADLCEKCQTSSPCRSTWIK